MSQQEDRCSSHSSFVRGKKQRSAVPCAREQQPAGCQKASWALQRTKGRNGDGPSLAPRKRTESARPWNGAGHWGKRKASPAGAGRLAAKRSLAGSQKRSMEYGTAPKRGRGAERNGKIYVKAPLQAGGLPGTTGPSTGERASPAVDNRPLYKTTEARKRKGVEEEEQKAELWPAKKQVKMECNGQKAQSPHQSRGDVPAPAAHPGPAPALTERFRTSKQRERGKEKKATKSKARRRRQKQRKVEMKKAALRAATACAESSAMNSLVEMMEKLQLKD
ncbi:zinc finger CCCH domain-containing protein 11A-like isoform X2 [Meleagris gallopavo]|uniref:zinc finger CCCH domain-containing protein 11A-like isoform X2 n=1 Tax=Meleagris gallopavo TaxID=9103 RepID=UPI00093C1F5F|nr:zinc finger CCCH domain-containing protein 11A-like isoform X2 [Meleagris gallopavo]